MGGGRLWEVVAYGRWSLMRGGRLWEVVVHGGSTVYISIMYHVPTTPLVLDLLTWPRIIEGDSGHLGCSID